MCCGNKRAQLQNGPAQRPLRNPHLPLSQPRVAPPAADPQTSVQLYYLETSPIRVQGLSTGRSYEFSGSERVQSVDARDASSLLNTRYFRRA
jgi:hypothetical protein